MCWMLDSREEAVTQLEEARSSGLSTDPLQHRVVFCQQTKDSCRDFCLSLSLGASTSKAVGDEGQQL